MIVFYYRFWTVHQTMQLSNSGLKAIGLERALDGQTSMSLNKLISYKGSQHIHIDEDNRACFTNHFMWLC